MNDGMMWVVLTDGNYIKIMFTTERGGELKTLRDGDFEQTSVIAYKMVTRKRALTLDAGNQAGREQELEFFLKLVAEFLQSKQEANAWQHLVFVAPGDLTDRLAKFLPAEVSGKVVKMIQDDYLPFTQDKLQQKLASII